MNLLKTTTFVRRVNVEVPVGRGVEKFSFDAEFKSIDRAQLEGRGDAEILEDALVSVGEFMPAEMTEGANPDQLREAVINSLPASQAAVLAFLAATRQEAPKAKTSRR